MACWMDSLALDNQASNSASVSIVAPGRDTRRALGFASRIASERAEAQWVGSAAARFFHAAKSQA